MNVCVYGASSTRLEAHYLEEVEKLGKMLAEKGHTLVFGAGAHGMMGAAARGVAAEGGSIIGVTPRFFDVDGIVYKDCTELIYTETMRERKQIMEEKANAFVMVPGGIGTFEEFFEILTLKQLGKHNKPIIVYNVNHYFDELIAFMNKAIEEKFMQEACRGLYYITDSREDLFDYLDHYQEKDADISLYKYIKEPAKAN